MVFHPKTLPPCQYPIWDPVYDDLADDKRYSPQAPGVYTWPLDGEEGFYSKLYVGRDGPTTCGSVGLPYGVGYEGCFSTESSWVIFEPEGALRLPKKGAAGMTIEVSHAVQVCPQFWSISKLTGSNEKHWLSSYNALAGYPAADLPAVTQTPCGHGGNLLGISQRRPDQVDGLPCRTTRGNEGIPWVWMLIRAVESAASE